MADAQDGGNLNLGYSETSLHSQPSNSIQTQKPDHATTSPSGSADVMTSQEPLSADSLSEEVDRLQQQLGGYGRYQWLIYFLIGLVYMRGGWHVWVLTPQAYEPGHHCRPASGQNLSESVPGFWTTDGTWEWESCSQYVNRSVSNDTVDCDRGFVYDWGPEGGSSPVTKYDLVCEASYVSTVTSTMYMVGTTCGVVFLTPLSDRLGSKTVMLACLWVQAIFGTCLIWAPDVIWYSVIKVFIGMCNMTIALCAYVLMTETFDAAHRELPTIFMQVFWAVSIMSLALFGYLMPRWEHVELTIALPVNILSIAYLWLIPESLPWLLSKGKIKQAEAVVQRYLRVNNLPAIPNLSETLEKFSKSKKEKTSHGSFHKTYSQISKKSLETDKSTGQPAPPTERALTVLDLFKHPRMALWTVLLFYLFLANALAYIGIMYTAPNLSGDRFLNMFLLGVVELPAYLLCYLANRWIGRRRSICIFLLICAVSNIGILFVPEDKEWLSMTLMMVGKFGITGSYSTIYLYAAEVFPTVLRHQAVGACSFFENIGSMAAPSMDLLKVAMDNLPLGIFGGLTMVGSLVVLFLPETHRRVLPQTIADAVTPRQREVKTARSDCTTAL